MSDGDTCPLCGYDRRGGRSRVCPECGFDAETFPCLPARDPNDPREVGVQVMLLLVALVTVVAAYLAFRNTLLTPAPFVMYSTIVLAVLFAVIGIIRIHHRSGGWTLVLRIEHDGLSFWSKRRNRRQAVVPWHRIRYIDVTHVRETVSEFRIRYRFLCRGVRSPSSTIFVAADNTTALAFAARIADCIAFQRSQTAALTSRSSPSPSS